MATFGLEGKIAELADVGPHVGVRADVFLQHAGFLAANAALLADVFAPTAPAHVHIVFVGLVPVQGIHEPSLTFRESALYLTK